jgi:hypothetical protein
MKQLMITKLVREGVSQFKGQFVKDDGLDEAGLIASVESWLIRTYPQIVRVQIAVLVRRTISDMVRQAVKATRPTANEIEGCSESGQMALPTLEEATRELYRPGRGQPMPLAEMNLKQVFAAVQEYGDNERENSLKRRRLEIVAGEMLRRGFSERDRVRKLYAA